VKVRPRHFDEASEMKDEWTGTPINIAIDVASPMIDFSEAELISRLNNFEDHFVERKSAGDSKDWLKTGRGSCELGSHWLSSDSVR
jgi:hypothetical protein